METAAELADACAARFDACDVLLMAAAVADYRPADAHAGKLKKDEAGEELNLRLVRTTDVLSALADRRRPGQLLVGFAAEHGDGALAYGREKLERKKLDAVVVNDISGAGIGFESTDNEVWIVTADGERHVPKASKARVAARHPRRRLEPPFIKRHKGSTLNGTVGGSRPGAARAGRDRRGRVASPGASPRTSARAVEVRDEVLEHVIVALLAEGHILVEDYPGVGKTALARALSRSIDCQFARVQCTADLLPADIVGTQIYNQREARFEFRPGPDLRQRRARRRGQPRVAEDAVRPARVHAGAPRHRRRARRTSSPGRSWSSRPRTRSSTRAPTRCPRRRSTASWSGSRSATRTPPPRPGCSPATSRGDRVLDLEPVADRAEIVEAVGGRAPRARLARAARLHRRAAAPHARGRARRARRLPARGPDAAARREGPRARRTAATTRSPTTSRRSPTPCSRTA